MWGGLRDYSMDLASHHWSTSADLEPGRRRLGAETQPGGARSRNVFGDAAYCSINPRARFVTCSLCDIASFAECREPENWSAVAKPDCSTRPLKSPTALAFFRCAHSGTQAAQAAHKRPKRPTPVKSLTLTLIAQLILTLSSPRVGCCSPHALQPHHAGRMSGRLGPVRSAWRAQEGLRRRDARDEQLRHQRQCRRCCSCLSTCASRA